jgi:hypothetical protein
VLGLRVEVLYSRHALIFPKSGNFRKVTSVIRQTSTTQLHVQTVPKAAALGTVAGKPRYAMIRSALPRPLAAQRLRSL